MSLFIASLAWEGSGADVYSTEARIGILTGSLLSAVTGFFLIYYCSAKPESRKS